MKLLIDESLSAEVARRLSDAGHDVRHVSDEGLLGAPDTDVLRVAGGSGRVLISADTDFGELLALGRHPGPSVVLLRRAPHRPDAQAALLLANLPAIEDSLAGGVVAVISAELIRVRRLPIEPEV